MAIPAGLILEGGGMRGTYTAGVLDCLLDNGILFRHVYGVSAGACHACSYLSGQRGRALRTVTDFNHDRHYAGLYSFLATGDFFGVQMIYHDIPDRLLPYDYEAFCSSGADFNIVVTDMLAGRAAYKKATDLRKDMLYVQASSSLPLLSRPVMLDGRPYLDGGISDSIPLARAIHDGFARNLVVLTRHRGYEKTPDSMLPLMKRKYRKFPHFVRALEGRHIQYNAALALVYRQEARGDAVVIQPQKPVSIGRLEKDTKKLKALYEEGYRDASAQLHEIRALVNAPVATTITKEVSQ